MALAEMMSLVQKQVEQAFKDVQSAYDATRYDMKDENELMGSSFSMLKLRRRWKILRR